MTYGAARTRERGYSLLEMLAAVFIMALASGLVVTSLPSRAEPRDAEALAFAAKLKRAADEAVLSGLVVGVDVDAEGYQFRRRVAGAWVALEDQKAFGAAVWSDDAEVLVETAGDGRDQRRLADLPSEAITSPVLRLDPAGAATPAKVRVSYADAEYTVSVGADGAIELEGG